MQQKEAQRILQGLLQSAKQHDLTPEHILLSGRGLICVRTLQAVLAEVQGLTLRHSLGSVLERAGDMAALLSSLNSGSLLFIDDLHRLAKPSGDLLAQGMDSFTMRIEIGRGPTMKTMDLRLPKFCLVGATSHPELLNNRLKQGFKHQIWIDDPLDPPSSTKVLIH